MVRATDDRKSQLTALMSQNRNSSKLLSDSSQNDKDDKGEASIRTSPGKQASPAQSPPRKRRRGPRLVVSDDSDEDSEPDHLKNPRPLADFERESISAGIAVDATANIASSQEAQQKPLIDPMASDAPTVMQTGTLEGEGIKQTEETVTDIDELFKERFVLECFWLRCSS